jgi:UDPglucose 6-dehydrogenase
MKHEPINIGVIGYGIVGRAVADYYAKRDWCGAVYVNDVREIFIDGYKFHNSSLDEMVKECRIIFLCVPTPRHPINGGCDLSIVYDVHGKLQIAIARMLNQKKEVEAKTLPVIAVKSTVIPGTCQTLIAGYAHTCSAPEFTTAKNSDDDMAYPDRVIIGTDSQLIRDTFLAYEERSCDLIFCTPTEAELIKYLSNAYLLYKVAYSEEMKRICNSLGASPKVVARGVGLDSRIQMSHLEPRGKLDPDSPCLPKDLDALIQFLRQRNYDTELFSDTRKQSVKLTEEEKQCLQ